VRRCLIRRNPATTVDLPRPSPVASSAWTSEEVPAFLTATGDDHLAVLYRLLVLTGLLLLSYSLWQMSGFSLDMDRKPVIVSGLVQGDTVTIVSGPQAVGDLDWYEVQTAYGEDGWLAGVYLGTPSETSGTTAVGAQEAGPTATPEAATPTAAFPEGSYVFIAGDGESVNLRADASIDSDVVSELADGAIGSVTGAPTTAGDYDWYPVSFGTGDATVTGFVAGSLLTGGITVGSAAVVADGPLNVRDDTSVDTDPIAQLDTGAAVTVVAGPTDVDGVAWFEIQSGDTNGYVSGRYLGLEAAAAPTEAIEATDATPTPDATETADTTA